MQLISEILKLHGPGLHSPDMIGKGRRLPSTTINLDDGDVRNQDIQYGAQGIDVYLPR